MITDTFDPNSKAIISCEDFTGGRKDFPKYMLVSFTEEFTDRILKRYCGKKTGKIMLGHRIPVYTLPYEDMEIGYVQSDIGGPAAVTVLENLFARGCEKILFFGSCGALTKNLPKGHLIVPDKAYRDEGTSYHYAPPSDYISVPTADRLSSIMDELKISHLKAATWTTDAIFRETQENARKRKNEGCMAVEMECASLMACAQFRNREIYQFLYTADCLDGDYDLGLLKDASEDTWDLILKAALKCMMKL